MSEMSEGAKWKGFFFLHVDWISIEGVMRGERGKSGQFEGKKKWLLEGAENDYWEKVRSFSPPTHVN